VTTSATISYAVTPTGPVSQQQLMTALEAISLDPTVPNTMGATLTSDTTAIVGAAVVRTLVWDISSSEFQTNFPVGTDQGAIFRDLYTQTIGFFIKSKVAAGTVVIA
jgi:hypothetical protein